MVGISRTKFVAASVTVGLGIAAVGAAAYAYWGATGEGSVSTGSVAIELKQIGEPTVLAPGARSLVRVNVRNISSGPLRFGTLMIDVDPALNAQADSALPACTPADFETGSYAINDEYAAGGGLIVEVGLKMKNLPTNQSNCRNLKIPLVLSMDS